MTQSILKVMNKYEKEIIPYWKFHIFNKNIIFLFSIIYINGGGLKPSKFARASITSYQK